MKVTVPRKLKNLKYQVVQNQFFTLEIEKDDLSIDLIGDYDILVQYTYKQNNRRVIKVLDLKISKI